MAEAAARRGARGENRGSPPRRRPTIALVAASNAALAMRQAFTQDEHGCERAAAAHLKLLAKDAPGEDFLRLAAGLTPAAESAAVRRDVACTKCAARSPATERRARWQQYVATRRAAENVVRAERRRRAAAPAAAARLRHILAQRRDAAAARAALKAAVQRRVEQAQAALRSACAASAQQAAQEAEQAALRRRALWLRARDAARCEADGSVRVRNRIAELTAAQAAREAATAAAVARRWAAERQRRAAADATAAAALAAENGAKAGALERRRREEAAAAARAAAGRQQVRELEARALELRQASDLAASELRTSLAAEKQAAAAATTPGRKRDAAKLATERGCDAPAPPAAADERYAAAAKGGARCDTLVTLTLAERRRELVVRAAVRQQAAQRAAEAASWAQHTALKEQRQEAVQRTAEHTERMRAAAAAAAAQVVAARAEAARRRASRDRAEAERLDAAADAAREARAIRAEHRALVAAAAAAVKAERKALQAARRSELLRSGRERFVAVMRSILLVKRAVAKGQASATWEAAALRGLVREAREARVRATAERARLLQRHAAAARALKQRSLAEARQALVAAASAAGAARPSRKPPAADKQATPHWPLTPPSTPRSREARGGTIKAGAERAMLKLRGLAPTDVGQLRSNRAVAGEVLKPFLAACEVKSPKLVSIALASIQKLLANDLVTAEGMLAVTRALEQVEKLNDEGVKLKTLQTALTLMQSPVLAQSEEGVAAVLGLCFRLLADPKNSDSVVNTAAATVRQAVALVFEHVTTAGPVRAAAPAASGAPPLSPRNAGLLAEHGPANAALKLLDDLCMMVTANEAMLKWLRAPALPRPFVLELLDFVLGHSAAVFREIPAFEHALLVRVCMLLTTQLQNLLDPACDPALQVSDLRIVLKVVRTVLCCFHRQLRAKAGVFVEGLIAGTAPACTLWQRINVMQALRALAGDAYILYFLFTTYDLKQECKLNAVTDMVRCFADVMDAATGAPLGEGDDPVQVIAGLYQSKAAGKEWTLDADFGRAPPETGAAYLGMLATDALLAVVAAVEKLTDLAVEGCAPSPDHSGVPLGPPGGALVGPGLARDPVDASVCAVLAGGVWPRVLSALGSLLARSGGEALTLQLLKGYQAFTQAAGLLGLTDARDAFLTSLCTFTLGSASEELLSPSDGRGDASSPTAAGSSGREFHRLASAQPQRGGTAASGGGGGGGGGGGDREGPGGEGGACVLTPKNVQALRTLFNVAHRLAPLLGPSWPRVLETLDALDRILHSPRTTTQEISNGSGGGLPSDLAILAVAASQLFESTRALDTEAVEDVLAGLAIVSARAVPAAVLLPGPPKLFALARMVDVLRVNLHRLRALWPAFQAHVAALLATPRPPVLQRHGEALRAGWPPVLALLEAVPGGSDARAVGAAFQAVQLLAADHLAALPLPLLAHSLRVAALYASQQVDMNVSLTAIALLWNAADQLAKLAAHGDGGGAHMGGERTTVDSAPASKPVHPAAEALSAAHLEALLRQLFSALQGLAGDARPEVRNSAVRTLFAVVVSQGARLGPAAWDECLWQMLFPLLRSVHHMAATSSREEAAAEILGRVRGESVPMLVHHSRNSAQKQWDETLVLALGGMGRLLRAHLPLLAHMPAFSQGWEELMSVVESAVAGGRKEVALAAIAVLTAVLGAHGGGPAVSEEMWRRALRAAGVGVEAASTPSCTVPLMARLALVDAIGQLLAALKSVLRDDDVRGAYVWLQRLACNPYADDDAPMIVHGTLPPVQKAVLCLLPTLAPADAPALWADYLSTLLDLLRPELLTAGPPGPPDVARGRAGAACESSIGSNRDGGARELLSRGGGNVNRHALSAGAMECVIDILARVYRNHAPWQVRAAGFGAVAAALGACMATRHRLYHEQLWRAAAAAWPAVVAAGLPAVHLAYAEAGGGDPGAPAEAWAAMARAFEAFLLGSDATTAAADCAEPAADGAPRSTADGEGAAADAELEAAVLDTLTDVVLTACGAATAEEVARLVAVVDAGVARPRRLAIPASAAGSRFPQLCLRKLYVLCSRGAEAGAPQGCLLQVARTALPVFLARARGMLRGYVAAEAAAAAAAGADLFERPTPGQERASSASGRGLGSRPALDRLALGELLCLLDTLAAMALAPAVADAALPPGSALQALVAVRRAPKGVEARERSHLLSLFPELAACVGGRETRVQAALRELLLAAGAQLGLVAEGF
ncbi:hypothetical protein WJX81_004391 [Elliptochloris bilobata]|uniref:Protein MON2 homolog n=1 Tax=Elliptochloris bilobata TaxID=381761 RepID=A0AAW1RJX0_9CHLO